MLLSNVISLSLPRAEATSSAPPSPSVRVRTLKRDFIHDLRHSFASTGVSVGLGLPIVGKLLGHTQVQTTNRYAHPELDPLRRGAEFIGQQLAAAMGELAADSSAEGPS